MDRKKITSFIEDDNGATAIEYALVAALVSVVIITALQKVGESLSQTYDSVNNAFSGDVSVAPDRRPPGADADGGGGSGGK